MKYAIRAKDGAYKRWPGDSLSSRYTDDGYSTSLYGADLHRDWQGAKFSLDESTGKFSAEQGGEIVALKLVPSFQRTHTRRGQPMTRTLSRRAQNWLEDYCETASIHEVDDQTLEQILLWAKGDFSRHRAPYIPGGTGWKMDEEELMVFFQGIWDFYAEYEGKPSFDVYTLEDLWRDIALERGDVVA
mgnify:CR=1 FL=1